MTEQDWLTRSDLTWMLEFLRKKVSDRNLRLFACSCCHGIWHLLIDDRSRRVIKATEQYVDGLIKRKEWAGAYAEAVKAENKLKKKSDAMADAAPQIPQHELPPERRSNS